jgi:hypothetical protein
VPRLSFLPGRPKRSASGSLPESRVTLIDS